MSHHGVPVPVESHGQTDTRSSTKPENKLRGLESTTSSLDDQKQNNKRPLKGFLLFLLLLHLYLFHGKIWQASCALCDNSQDVDPLQCPAVVCDTCGNIHHVACLRSLPEARAVVPTVTNYTYVCSKCSENSFHWIVFGKPPSGAYANAIGAGVTLLHRPSVDGQATAFTLEDAVAWVSKNAPVAKLLSTARNPRGVQAVKRALDKSKIIIGPQEGKYRLSRYPIGNPYIPSLKKRLKSEFLKKKKKRKVSSVRGSRGVRPPRPRGLLYVPKVSLSPNQALIGTNSAQSIIVSKNNVSSIGGFQSARAAWPLRVGETGYFEVAIPANFKGHCRVGWSQIKMNLEGPVGFDKFSFGIRDVNGAVFHKGIGRNPIQAVSYGAGDVIGSCLSLQKDNTFLSYVKNGVIVADHCFPQQIPLEKYFPTVSIFTSGQERMRVSCNFGPDWAYPPSCQLLGVDSLVQGRDYVSRTKRKSSTKRPTVAAVPPMPKKMSRSDHPVLLPPIGKKLWSFDEDYELSMMICHVGAHRPVTKVLDEQWFFEKPCKELAHIHPHDVFLRYMALIPLIRKFSSKIEGGNFSWLTRYRESISEMNEMAPPGSLRAGFAPPESLIVSGSTAPLTGAMSVNESFPKRAAEKDISDSDPKKSKVAQ